MPQTDDSKPFEGGYGGAVQWNSKSSAIPSPLWRHNPSPPITVVSISVLSAANNQKATDRSYCKESNRFFPYKGAIDQHCDAVHNFGCSDGDRKISSDGSLHRHQKATLHAYCGDCDRFLRHEDAVRRHNDAYHCFLCPYCDRNLASEALRKQHQRATRHQ